MKYSKKSVSSRRTLHYIKLFESFDNDNGDYIVSSIRDILIELEDEGMQVSVEYQPEEIKYVRTKFGFSATGMMTQPSVTIEIKGESIPAHWNGDGCEEFEVSSVRDYIDTLIDFIEDTWISYDLYFEKYDIDDSHIEDGKVLKDGKCGSIVIQIQKREI